MGRPKSVRFSPFSKSQPKLPGYVGLAPSPPFKRFSQQNLRGLVHWDVDAAYRIKPQVAHWCAFVQIQTSPYLLSCQRFKS